MNQILTIHNFHYQSGIGACICAVTYGFWNIKKRGNLPLSLYLIHMRVGAQGMVVGTLALGVTYGLAKRLYNMANGIDTWEQEHGKNRHRDPDGR